MSLFDKYFFGYLPEKIRAFVRFFCVLFILFLIIEIAITFIFTVFIIAIISKLLMKFFN
tara:strand:- start:1514 stop:1690 length:177 start_codon:yes stop_codon:yes gene_type:complete